MIDPQSSGPVASEPLGNTDPQPSGPINHDQAKRALEVPKNTFQAATDRHLAELMVRNSRIEHDYKCLQEKLDDRERELDDLRPKHERLKSSLEHLKGLSILSTILFAVGSGLISDTKPGIKGAGWACIVIGIFLSLYGTGFLGAFSRRLRFAQEGRRK